MDRQLVAAVVLSVVGLACGAWLVYKAGAEISAAVALPRGAR
jgi:hypothetical protein